MIEVSGEFNIQGNGIGPGYIATPQTAPLREPQADGSKHPFDIFICAKTPAGRWLNPEELVGPAVFLASSASDAVNGHILYVDGGILAYIVSSLNKFVCINYITMHGITPLRIIFLLLNDFVSSYYTDVLFC